MRGGGCGGGSLVAAACATRHLGAQRAGDVAEMADACGVGDSSSGGGGRGGGGDSCLLSRPVVRSRELGGAGLLGCAEASVGLLRGALCVVQDAATMAVVVLVVLVVVVLVMVVLEVVMVVLHGGHGGETRTLSCDCVQAHMRVSCRRLLKALIQYYACSCMCTCMAMLLCIP